MLARYREHPLRKRFVFARRGPRSRGTVARARRSSREIGRVVAALLEILIARGALLAVPALLVGHVDRRQNREPLNRQRDVRQVGDGAMAVLKIKGIEKLLRLLRADLLERFFHGERRARILGHGIGLNLRLYAVHRENFGRRRRSRQLLRGAMFSASDAFWESGGPSRRKLRPMRMSFGCKGRASRSLHSSQCAA